MKLESSLQMRPEQRQLLLPRLLQAVEVLQIPVLALSQWIRDAAAANEALLLEEEESAAVEPDPSLAGADPMEFGRPAARGGEQDFDLLAMQAAPSGSLAEELWSQVAALELAPGVREAFDFLVAALDRNGHLGLTLAEAREARGGAPGEEAWLEAYALLRSLEPRGVGAGDPIECVLSQVEADDPDLETFTRLLTEHLEDLGLGRLGKTARALGVGKAELARLLARLRGFEPFPGRAFQGEPARPVYPDLSVERRPEGGFEVRLEERGVPRLAVDPAYVGRLRRRAASGPARTEMAARLRHARWLVEALGHRRQTLLRVARELVERQHAFFERGPGCLAPLRMEEVARTLDLHLSTVSRTVAGKWLACDHGLVPLRRLFEGPASSAAGASRTAVRERIRALGAAEAAERPLSDAEIVASLGREGMRVARRTVAAHRAALEIPPAWKRRR